MAERGAGVCAGEVSLNWNQPSDQDPAKVAPNHSPNFFVNERALVVGTRTGVWLAVNFLSTKLKK